MKNALYFILWICATSAVAETERFVCKIKSVLDLNDNGNIITHGWSANYVNREFTIDAASGKVTSTTALKVRLSNYDKEHQPVVLREPNYRSITIFENDNNFSAIEIKKNAEGVKMPYIYRTNIGMMLTGTCQSQ